MIQNTKIHHYLPNIILEAFDKCNSNISEIIFTAFQVDNNLDLQKFNTEKLKNNTGSFNIGRQIQTLLRNLSNLVTIFQKLLGSSQTHRVIMLVNVVTVQTVIIIKKFIHTNKVQHLVQIRNQGPLLNNRI